MFDAVDDIMKLMGEVYDLPMGFTEMRDNYDERKVDKYEEGELFISTCMVTDADVPYETAVGHSAYREEGKLIIVETYATKELAQEGHNRWVEKMTSDELPESLTDVSQAELSLLLREVDPDSMVYQREGDV